MPNVIISDNEINQILGHDKQRALAVARTVARRARGLEEADRRNRSPGPPYTAPGITDPASAPYLSHGRRGGAPHPELFDGYTAGEGSSTGSSTGSPASCGADGLSKSRRLHPSRYGLADGHLVGDDSAWLPDLGIDR
jgi:hypothetical protein